MIVVPLQLDSHVILSQPTDNDPTDRWACRHSLVLRPKVTQLRMDCITATLVAVVKSTRSCVTLGLSTRLMSPVSNLILSASSTGTCTIVADCKPASQSQWNLFPSFIKRNYGKQRRSFLSAWYYKYQWLHYQEQDDSVLCYYCMTTTTEAY